MHKDKIMVAWIGYQKIIKFSELKQNQLFASSKTGREYIFRHETILTDETFYPDELVYINFLPEGAIN